MLYIVLKCKPNVLPFFVQSETTKKLPCDSVSHQPFMSARPDAVYVVCYFVFFIPFY